MTVIGIIPVSAYVSPDRHHPSPTPPKSYPTTALPHHSPTPPQPYPTSALPHPSPTPPQPYPTTALPHPSPTPPQPYPTPAPPFSLSHSSRLSHPAPPTRALPSGLAKNSIFCCGCSPSRLLGPQVLMEKETNSFLTHKSLK
jgi:hypothetical protein